MKSEKFNTIIGTSAATILLLLLTFSILKIFIPESEIKDAFVWGILDVPIALYYWLSGARKIGIITAKEWAGVCIGTLIIAGISFLMDCGFGYAFHLGKSGCESGMHGVGFVFTLICIGMAIISFAGSFRIGVITWLTKFQS